MISTSKSYKENIADKSNQHYSIIVEKFLSSGEICPGHMLLLNTPDIQNIILLGFIYIKDIDAEMATKVFGEYKSPIRHEPDPSFWGNKIQDAKSNLGKLSMLVPENDRINMLKSMGRDFIIESGADEVEELANSLRAYANTANARQQRALAQQNKAKSLLEIKNVFENILENKKDCKGDFTLSAEYLVSNEKFKNKYGTSLIYDMFSGYYNDKSQIVLGIINRGCHFINND